MVTGVQTCALPIWEAPEKMYENGDRKAGKLLKLVEEPAGFLSTIQIGITLAEDKLSDQMSMEEFIDPFTGEPVEGDKKKKKSKRPFEGQ